MHRVIPILCLVFALAVVGSFSMPWSEFLIDGEVVSSQSGVEMLEGYVNVIEEDSPIKDGAAQAMTVLWGVLAAAALSAIGALALFAPPIRRFGYMALPGGGMIIASVLMATYVTGFPFENGVEVLTDELRRAAAGATDASKADVNALIESMSTRRGKGFYIALVSGLVITIVGWFYTSKVKVSDAVAGLGKGDDGGPIDVREKYAVGGGGEAVDVRHKYLDAGDPLLADASDEWEYVDDDDASGEWVYEDEAPS